MSEKKSVDEVLATLRSYRHRGAYQEAADYFQLLPREILDRPAIALERFRTRMRQGRIDLAQAVLQEVGRNIATPGEALILGLESASLQIFRNLAIRPALAHAAAAFEAAGNELDPLDRLEAEGVRARILLIAGVFYEVDRETVSRTLAIMSGLAEGLKQGGRFDAAFALLLTRAERLAALVEQEEAFLAVAESAVAAGFPGLGGEAHLSLAHRQLEAGAASVQVHASAEIAAALFVQAGHVHGPIDVRRLLAILAIERGLVGLDPLVACLEEYHRIDYPRGAVSVLMTLSQLAHERGDLTAAERYRRQTLQLAEETGLGMIRDGFLMAQADLLMRGSFYGTAIELCRAALAADPPQFNVASYELLMASAYSLIGDFGEAASHRRRALEVFDSIGAEDSASLAAQTLAGDLQTARDDAGWSEAVRLLEIWRLKDQQRGDFASAIAKSEQMAQISIERFNQSPTQSGDPELLAAADREIATAEELARHLENRESARRAGNLRQLRGQVQQARGDTEGVERSWRDALRIYEAAGLAMEAANCQYILGVIRLNLANADLMSHFSEAETRLNAALAYYELSGMRSQAADTHFMIARLYINTAPKVSDGLADAMGDAALSHLASAEANFDTVRREYAPGSVLEAQTGKQALASKSRRIYELALEIFLSRSALAPAWEWTQRAKARALVDSLGASSIPPARILTALETHPESLALVMRERELASRVESAAPGDRPVLQTELAVLRQSMGDDSNLADYLELRTGASLDRADLETMLAPEAAAGRPCVCVDWVSQNDRLFLFILRPGCPPQCVPLALSLRAIRSFLVENLARESFRQTLRDAPELLRQLDPLLTPLGDLTHPEELLVLSPTGPLNALPLHALEIEGEPLLARNPVTYSPSLSVLRHCLSRRPNRTKSWTAALFGDPSGDRDEAAALVQELARRFGTQALVRRGVTRTAFAAALSYCDLIHFQGHAKQESRAPLDSYLLLADGAFTARDIFGLRDLRAELVTLAACESAANVMAVGDEPLGLIPAFLYAGASAVLATLWRVHRASASDTMLRFYDALGNTDKSVDKAQALRAAMLAIRATPGFESPYHWAPFVLYGDWH